MNNYEPARPRTAIALAAAALTALTIGLLVVAPAKFDAANPDARVLAATKVAPGAPIEVTIIPSTIEVIGIREREVASVQIERPVVEPLATR
ncbi:MAG: hypothetical protein ABI777_07355 [Betaproteobacteria bacterium]